MLIHCDTSSFIINIINIIIICSQNQQHVPFDGVAFITVTKHDFIESL